MPAPRPESLVDSVDAADRPVGVIERRRIFQAKVGFRVVHVLVFDPSGRILLQRLSRTRDRNPGRWGSSVAGYVHAGEAYWHAAKRRLNEELELSTPLIKLGNTVMMDQGCRKFVEVYRTATTEARIGEPEHIDAIEFREIPQVNEEVVKSPAEFTETFRHVFGFYQSTLSLDTGPLSM